jgi:hypothetical protein
MSCPHLASTRKISVKDMSHRQQVGFVLNERVLIVFTKRNDASPVIVMYHYRLSRGGGGGGGGGGGLFSCSCPGCIQSAICQRSSA